MARSQFPDQVLCCQKIKIQPERIQTIETLRESIHTIRAKLVETLTLIASLEHLNVLTFGAYPRRSVHFLYTAKKRNKTNVDTFSGYHIDWSQPLNQQQGEQIFPPIPSWFASRAVIVTLSLLPDVLLATLHPPLVASLWRRTLDWRRSAPHRRAFSKGLDSLLDPSVACVWHRGVEKGVEALENARRRGTGRQQRQRNDNGSGRMRGMEMAEIVERLWGKWMCAVVCTCAFVLLCFFLLLFSTVFFGTVEIGTGTA